MGKLILLFLVLVGIIAIWQLNRYLDKRKLEKIALNNKTSAKSNVNELIDSVNLQIKEIEKDSTLNAVEAEAKLKFHNEELEKLNNLKNKLS